METQFEEFKLEKVVFKDIRSLKILACSINSLEMEASGKIGNDAQFLVEYNEIEDELIIGKPEPIRVISRHGHTMGKRFIARKEYYLEYTSERSGIERLEFGGQEDSRVKIKGSLFSREYLKLINKKFTQILLSIECKKLIIHSLENSSTNLKDSKCQSVKLYSGKKSRVNLSGEFDYVDIRAEESSEVYCSKAKEGQIFSKDLSSIRIGCEKEKTSFKEEGQGDIHFE